MRRFLAFLIAAVIVAIALRRESAPTQATAAPTTTTSTQTSTAPAPTRSAQTPSTNSGKGFRDRAHLDEHFTKHGREFSGLNKAQYLSMAQTLRDAPAGGNILEIVRSSDGVVSRFDTRTGAFIAFDRDGTIRTFFKPNDGEKYFRRQANRAPSQ